MRRGGFRFWGLTFLIAASAQGVSKNFDETLTGISMGGGALMNPGFGTFPDFDPVPGLGGSYTTLGKTDGAILVPAKFGYYIAQPGTQFEIYGRYVRSTLGEWYGSGANAGIGTTTFGSLGAGVLLGTALASTSRFRLSLVGTVEWIRQIATLKYSTGGTTETLRIRSTSILAGGGLLGEIYLGDLWMLNMNASYLYGRPAVWSAASAATFMGTHQSGTLRDSSGDPINARFGGLLLEASLRLAFY